VTSAGSSPPRVSIRQWRYARSGAVLVLVLVLVLALPLHVTVGLVVVV
jgi:hypothetical protein